MAKETKKVSDEEEEYLKYEINAQGDVYITINAGRNAEVKVMSGQPTNPNPKPPGGGS